MQAYSYTNTHMHMYTHMYTHIHMYTHTHKWKKEKEEKHTLLMWETAERLEVFVSVFPWPLQMKSTKKT